MDRTTQVVSMPEGARKKLIIWIAKGFGLGSLKPAPGTWGSLGGVVLGFALSALPVWIAIGCLVCLTFLAVWVADETERYLGCHDPGCVVIDEIVGMGFALAGHCPNFIHIVGLFLLFRLFDILKPFPIRYLEKLKGGFGVMMDDVAAGVAANLVWRLIDVAILW